MSTCSEQGNRAHAGRNRVMRTHIGTHRKGWNVMAVMQHCRSGRGKMERWTLGTTGGEMGNERYEGNTGTKGRKGRKER